MYKIYGSEMCPDCLACKLNFDTYGVKYEFIDINASLKNLSVFLEMRDENPVFDHCKKIKDIGLPALVKEDDTVFLNWESIILDMGKEVLNQNVGKACHIGRKGC